MYARDGLAGIFYFLYAYKWGMEKIIIACSAANVKYEFPKRKWYQWKQYDRIALMRLHSVPKDALDAEILLQVHERYGNVEPAPGFVRVVDEQREFDYRIHPFYEREVWRGMQVYFSQLINKKEQLIVLDMGEPMLPEMVSDLTKDRNYLTVFARNPEDYEPVLQQAEAENGLVGMLFTDYKEFVRYVKQVTKDIPALVIAGKRDNSMEKIRGNLVYQVPKKSFFMDFCHDSDFFGPVSKKRIHFTYVSIPIFLDNIVKNRYNAVVNEGITFQVINKNVWRRKGNRDGRKEEYSDL